MQIQKHHHTSRVITAVSQAHLLSLEMHQLAKYTERLFPNIFHRIDLIISAIIKNRFIISWILPAGWADILLHERAIREKSYIQTNVQAQKKPPGTLKRQVPSCRDHEGMIWEHVQINRKRSIHNNANVQPWVIHYVLSFSYFVSLE